MNMKLFKQWVRRHLVVGPETRNDFGTPGEQVLLGKLAETDNQVVLIGGGSDRST